MSDRVKNLVAAALITASLAVIVAVLATAAPGRDDRVHSLASRLKCPVCTSESIADSPANLSRDLLALIEERVDQGWTDSEIVDFFVASYGESVLLDPPASGRGALLWLLPLVAAVVGIVVIAGRRAPRRDGTLPEEDRRLVEAALEERKHR